MPMKYSTLRSYTLPDAIRCSTASCEASVIMLSRPISSVGPQGLCAALPPVVWPAASPTVRRLAQTSAHRPMISEAYIACPPFLVQRDTPYRSVGGPHNVVCPQYPVALYDDATCEGPHALGRTSLVFTWMARGGDRTCSATAPRLPRRR